MLIIFGGLPGTGKTTIARQVAKHLNAAYLRIDTVEQVLKNLNNANELIGPEGYLISYAIAKDNLMLDMNVVADSVNPIQVTRQDWQQVAKTANKRFIEIELFCSNADEHQKRVESRVADIVGQNLPTWQDVLERDYELWESRAVKVDTTKYSIVESVQLILDYIKQVS